MALPITVPTRTIGSLGPVKRDLHPSPRFDIFVNSSEWNLLCAKVIELCEELNKLALAGTSGTLQGAYNNAQAPGVNPVRIVLDAVRRAVAVFDAAPALGGVLLGVASNAGANLYGLAAEGFQLPDLPGAVHSPPGVSVRMRSGQAPNSGSPPFILDTAAAITSEPIFEVRSAGLRVWSLLGDGGVLVFDQANAPLGLLYGLVPHSEGVSLLSNPPGASFTPFQSGVGKLGTRVLRWAGVHAHYFAGKVQNVVAEANLRIDCRLGNVAIVAMDADINSFDLTNPEEGMVMSILFRQGPASVRSIGLLGGRFILHGEIPFFLGKEPADEDVLVLQFNGTNWVELARNQRRPAEGAFRARSTAGGNISLFAHGDEHLQSIEGTLGQPLRIDFANPGALSGDRFELIFPETPGLVTTAANTLTISTDNFNTTLATFAQAKTLRGRVLAYYTGTAWKLSIGAALSYT